MTRPATGYRVSLQGLGPAWIADTWLMATRDSLSVGLDERLSDLEALYQDLHEHPELSRYRLQERRPRRHQSGLQRSRLNLSPASEVFVKSHTESSGPAPYHRCGTSPCTRSFLQFEPRRHDRTARHLELSP